MRTSKQQIHILFAKQIQDRIELIQSQIVDLSIDAQNDAKGSAGDKHETALAMMHLEQEKLTSKLQEVLQQKVILDSIDATSLHNVVALGSLITTNSFTFFMAAALPKITFETTDIIAISPQSPLGAILLGKKVGDKVAFNTSNYTITAID